MLLVPSSQHCFHSTFQKCHKMVLFFRARNLVQRQSSRTWKEKQNVLMVVTIISRYLRPLKNIMLEINIATGLVLFYVKGYKQNVDNIWSNFGQHTLIIIHKGNDTNQCIHRRENTLTFMAFTCAWHLSIVITDYWDYHLLK